ncbi:MAG: 16S rRNA (uracil(1498)-N(3))-methyltransferase [Woeseiaceae bacterium]
MRIPRIYLPLDLKEQRSFNLTDHAFQHAIKVLRMKENYQLNVFDGKGHEFLASLTQIEKKSASIEILHQIESAKESNLSIHLGLVISKGERMDFAIQKSVELGVTEITPLFSERCVVNLDEKRLLKRLTHWQGIIISACEQCGRSFLPKLNSAQQLNTWSDSVSNMALIFDPQASKKLNDLTPEDENITLVIGPEGGLSPDEIDFLNNKKYFEAIQFGPRILRTETAAISAITAMQILWGDLA